MEISKRLISWLKPKQIVCGCGHTSKLKKKVSAGGEQILLRINYKPDKQFPYCLDCVEKMTITCPWCGKPIIVGDYVTLYTPKDLNFQIPEGAVVYSEKPLQLVRIQEQIIVVSGMHQE